MNLSRRTFLSITGAATLGALASSAQDWPAFRGANRTGRITGANLPLEWDVDKHLNIRWSAGIPGLGHSSPVVARGHVFVTTAVANAGESQAPPKRIAEEADMTSSTDNGPQTWIVMCLRVGDGSVVWRNDVCTGMPRSKRHPLNSYATPTPSLSGDRLVVSFCSEGLYCFSLEGKQIWKQDLGILNLGSAQDHSFQWGYASSPAVYRDTVVVQCDADSFGYIAAFRLSDGKQVWRTKRDDLPSWSSPLIVDSGGHAQIVTLAPSFVRSYDLQTGDEIWRLYWEIGRAHV